jgi:hypothetical protein
MASARDKPGGEFGAGEVQAARSECVADHNMVGPAAPGGARIIEQDFTREQDFTVRKELPWESETAADAEARAIEVA